MGKQRIEYFDVLRGGAIIFVIAIHSFTGFDITENNTLTFHLAIIWRQLIGCAVPLFLAISGFFLSKKEVSTKNQYFSFLKKQVPRVYIPMLIWSIPYLILSIYTGKDIGTSIIILLVGGYSVYYFIALIVYMTTMQNISIPLILYAGPFPVWIVFFVLGIYMGKRDKLSVSSKSLFLLTLLGLLISIAETYLHIYVSGSFSGLGIKIGAFAYSSAIIVFMFSLNKSYTADTIIWRFLAHLGKISFGIYLIHLFILNYLIRQFVLNLEINNYLFNQILFITFTLICCIFVITLARRINNKLALKYFGF